MMWNDKEIRYAVEVPDIQMVFTPWERAKVYGQIQDYQFQPASLDVRLGDEFITHPSGDFVKVGSPWYYTLQPGDCVLGSLMERIRLPETVVARIEGKSTWARRFLTVHSAGFIDPGFYGDITLELKNDGKEVLHLTPGVLIAQLSFHSLDSPPSRPYGKDGLNSHYQNQNGTTPAR